MLLPIKSIVIQDRIRKDLGNIQELASDIATNGLINPPVVNDNHVLLAGERRVRACELLGWDQIEVRVISTRDAEHELNIEISENESRKSFSKAERVDYMRRLLRIEQAKAKERQGERNQTSDRNLTEVERSDDAVAKQFGVSRDTVRKELAIVDNKDFIPPDDFANWDEGKLSTNKAFKLLKKKLASLEEEKAKSTKKIDKLTTDYDSIKSTLEEKESSLATANAQIDELQSNVKLLQSNIEQLQSNVDQLESDTTTFTNAAFLERSGVNVYRALDGTDDIYELSYKVRTMLEEDLAPLKFRRCFERIPTSEIARENLRSLIDSVLSWCFEMDGILSNNNKANHHDEIVVEY